jgi:phosphoserine phosphatase RsbU/P
MKIAARAAKSTPRVILGWFAPVPTLVLTLVLALSLPIYAQAPAAAAPSATNTAAPANPATSPAPASNPLPPRIHGVLQLDGPWRFQVGDEPGWGDPGFDDSAWQPVTLSQTLTDQGFEPYTGYAWYRMTLVPDQLSQLGNLPGDKPLALLLTSRSGGQLAVYVDGIEVGHTRGMTDKPSMYQSPPLSVEFSAPAAGGKRVLAIRTWTGPSAPVGVGLLAPVELGAPDDIAERVAMALGRRWDQNVTAGLIVSFLFLSVAGLGATLFLAQRSQSEYLWLALLCLSVAFMGATETAFNLELLPSGVFSICHLWTGRIFMAITLEFVLRFTGGQYRRVVRTVQIAALLVPFFTVIHLQLIYEWLSLSMQVVFCALVSLLLFRAWRRGRLEAGVMLLPFFFAAAADSIDTFLSYAAQKHWGLAQLAPHSFHLGPIEFNTSTAAYTVFLASLIAVILYRFIHVSQEEQRSAAEIEAARSVQALLIPTQLPSNRNFMLESAYLPVNGVGGDFFQVLPLKDDSLFLVVGDVSGKGLQAAMNASSLVGALRNELSHDPATVLNHLNQVMLGAASGPVKSKDSVASFATCLCARIWPDGAMTIANAGHLSPYRDGRELELAADLPLGVLPNMNYEQATFHLKQGDRLIFLSDGVVEATNAHGELFGFERTQQVAHESARYIAQSAKHFGQNDDITVVSIYFAARSAQRAAQEVVHAG